MFNLRSKAISWAIFLLFSSAGSAQDTSAFSKFTSDQLLEQSLKAFSRPEKLASLSYLKTHYPNKPEGMSAKAYLQSYEDNFDTSAHEAFNYYQECLNKYPNFPFALYSIISLSSTAETMKYANELYNSSPQYFNYYPLKIIFETYYHTLKDTASARSNLLKWKSQLGDSYIIDYLQGIYQLNVLRNDSEAMKYLKKAIAKKPDDYEVYESYSELVLGGLLYDTTLTEGKIDTLLLPLKQFIESDLFSRNQRARIALYYGEVLVSARIQEAAFSYFRESFDLYPNSYAVSDAMELETVERSKRTEFGLYALKTLPDNHLILSTLGDYFTLTDFDEKKAEKYFSSSISASYTLKDTLSNILHWGRLYKQKTFDYDKELKLYTDWLSTLKVEKRKILLLSIYQNRRLAGDFKSALEYLEQYESYLKYSSKPNMNYFISKKRELNTYINYEEHFIEYYAKNSFLKYWQEEFGPQLVATINFENGSSDLTMDSKNYLKRIGRLIKEKGAAQYDFNIEGHCDPFENPGISKDRADQVKKYLYEEVEIPKSQLYSTFQGSKLPLYPNNDELTRSRNRRVEITPYGNLEDPSILVTAAFTVENQLSVSPDGKLLSIGYSPIQLWDIEKGTVVRNLGRGMKRKFSPNGRYLAASSNFVETGAIVVSALLIYDVKTGLTVNIIPEEKEI